MIQSKKIRDIIIMLNIIDSDAFKIDIMDCFNKNNAEVMIDGNVDIGHLIDDDEALKLIEHCKKQVM